MINFEGSNLGKIVCENLTRKLIKQVYMTLVYGNPGHTSATDIHRSFENLIT